MLSMKEVISQYKLYVILGLTALALGIILMVFGFGKGWLQNAFSRTNIGWHDSKGVYKAYDDREVYGSVVLGAIQKFPDKCVIKTSRNDGTLDTPDDDGKGFTIQQYLKAQETAAEGEIVDINTIGNLWYINPDSIFYSWLEYDEDNGELVAIHFEQRVHTNQIPFDFSKPTSAPKEEEEPVDLSKSKSIRELYVEQQDINIVEGDPTGSDWSKTLIVKPVYDDGTLGPALNYGEYTINYDPNVKISEDDRLSEDKKLIVTYKPDGAEGSCNQFVDVTIWKPLKIKASDDTLVAGHPVKITTNYSEGDEADSVRFTVDTDNAVLWEKWNKDSNSKETIKGNITALALEFSIKDNVDKVVTVKAERPLTGEVVNIKVKFIQFYGVYTNITANEDPTSEKAADKVDVQSKIATNDVLQFTVNSAADLYACKKGTKNVNSSTIYSNNNKINLFGEKGAPNTSEVGNLSVYPIRCAREVEPTKFYVRALAEGYTGVIARDKISGFTVNFMGKNEALIGGGAGKDTVNGYDGWIYPVLDFNFESTFSHNSNFVAVDGGTKYSYLSPFDSTFSIKTDKGTITLANKTAESEVSDKSQDDVDNKTWETWDSFKYWGSNAGLTLYDHFYGVGNEAKWAQYFDHFSEQGISSDYVTRNNSGDKIVANGEQIKNVTLADSNLDSKNGDNRMYHSYEFNMKPQGTAEIQVTYNNFGHRKQVCRIHTWYPLSADTCDPAASSDSTAATNKALVAASTTDNKYTGAGTRTKITMDSSVWGESGQATSIKIKQIVGHAVQIDLNQIYKTSDIVKKDYNFSSTIQIKDNANGNWVTLDNKDTETVNNSTTTITAKLSEQSNYFDNKVRDTIYLTSKVNTNHSVYIKVKRPITGEIIAIEIEFKAIGYDLFNQYNENDVCADGGSMYLGNSELKYAKLVNDTTNRMANGDIILAKAGVKDNANSTSNYADSTDTSKLKLLNYQLGSIKVNGQNGATVKMLACDKIDSSGNMVRFRLYDNDSAGIAAAFAKYTMNYNVGLEIPLQDRYKQTFNGVNFSGLTVSNNYTSYRFDNAITRPTNYANLALPNNLQNKPVTLWNYSINPQEAYSGILHRNILWNTSQVIPQTVKDCPFYINTIYKIKLSRGNGYTCVNGSEITNANGGDLLGKTVVSANGTYVRTTAVAEYAQFAKRAQTLVFDSWELASPKPTIPKDDPNPNPGPNPDPGRDEGGSPGIISGTDAATVQGHAIKVTEAHGYVDIDFGFTAIQDFDNNSFQYVYDREKCYLTSKRNIYTTKIQVNLSRFRTGEQTSCMTTFYPYEVHLYNGTTNRDYNAETNLFATGDAEFPFLYTSALGYRTYLRNKDNVGVAFTLYANNSPIGNHGTHANLLAKSNNSDGWVYFQTSNNNTYQAPISYAFGVTLKDEYSYTASMRTDGHTGSKDGASFSGIHFGGGDTNATSATANEFYTYRFDNLINNVTGGDSHAFHRTLYGSFKTTEGSIVLSPSDLSMINWSGKESIIAGLYSEYVPSVILEQFYRVNVLEGYAYDNVVAINRANMTHIGLDTCNNCSVAYNESETTPTLANVIVNCSFGSVNHSNTSLADSSTKHYSINKYNWSKFQTAWKKYKTGAWSTKPTVVGRKVTSLHQSGVAYWFENTSDSNLTLEFKGSQTNSVPCGNETYSVNEFFSKESTETSAPASVTFQYSRFAGRTKTVNFNVINVGTANFRPDPDKIVPDPDNTDTTTQKNVLRNYVGRPLYVEVKTVSQPDFNDATISVTFNGEACETVTRRSGNKWYGDTEDVDDNFYLRLEAKNQNSDGTYTSTFAITRKQNYDATGVEVTFNNVKCSVGGNNVVANITTSNTGNFYKYTANAYNITTTNVDYAWDKEDSEGVADAIAFGDTVQLRYLPGEKAAKYGLTGFEGQLIVSGTTAQLTPYKLKETNNNLGAPNSKGDAVTEGISVNDDGTNGYVVICTDKGINGVYVKAQAKDPSALVSPPVSVWHTIYYFNPNEATRFVFSDATNSNVGEQAEIKNSIQILNIGDRYKLGHTKHTDKNILADYVYRWRLIEYNGKTLNDQINALKKRAHALDNKNNVVEDETNSWHFCNWNVASVTGRQLVPKAAATSKETLYVQYPKFANRTGSIEYKMKEVDFTPFEATLNIGEGHCAVVNLNGVGGKAEKKSAYFTLDGTTTETDLSFNTSAIGGITAKTSDGTPTFKSKATDFEGMLKELNEWSKNNKQGIGAFYYKAGKLYFTGRKGGAYKRIDITLEGGDGDIVLHFNNKELQGATGVVLKDNAGNFIINQAYSINRGDTVVYTLKNDIRELFNASYRVSVSDTFIDMLNAEKYAITKDYVDSQSADDKKDYIDLMGIPSGKKRDDWETYIGALTELKDETKSEVSLRDDSASTNTKETACHVLGQTGTWEKSTAIEFINPTTGWKINTGKDDSVSVQRTLYDSEFKSSASGQNAYTEVAIKDLKALIVEIPDTSYIMNNDKAEFFFEIKDSALAEEAAFKAEISGLKLNSTDYPGFEGLNNVKYASSCTKEKIQIANNLFLQSEDFTVTGTKDSEDRKYTSSRSRALNVVQEGAHDDNGYNEADAENIGVSYESISTDKHFHFNSETQTFGGANEAYPVKCLKGASAILMSKGMFNMYTTRFNNTVLISQPNNEASVNALDFLNTSGLVSAKGSAYTAFSATQLIQNVVSDDGDGKGKVPENDKWNNHGITLSEVLTKVGISDKDQVAVEKPSTTTIKDGGGGATTTEETGAEKTFTKLSPGTLDQKLSTNYIMYDMTLKKTKFGSKQVAVFQTTKAGAGFKLVDPSEDPDITGSSTYTSTSSATTGDSYQVASNKGYSNANAFPNSMPAAKKYNYCINTESFSDKGKTKGEANEKRDATWVTSAKDGEPDTNCKITFTNDDPSTPKDNPTAFMPYTVASSQTAFNNSLTIWGDAGGGTGACCMLDIESVVETIKAQNAYKNSTIRYIDTYIDVCYNNNGFRQVRYPVRLVLN